VSSAAYISLARRGEGHPALRIGTFLLPAGLLGSLAITGVMTAMNTVSQTCTPPGPPGTVTVCSGGGSGLPGWAIPFLIILLAVPLATTAYLGFGSLGSVLRPLPKSHKNPGPGFAESCEPHLGSMRPFRLLTRWGSHQAKIAAQ
jgi:hypothetical protein